MSQYQIQSWRGLPDHFKRQAAPDVLAGKSWMFYGKLVENPGPDELRRWIADGAATVPPELKTVPVTVTTPNTKKCSGGRMEIVKKCSGFRMENDGVETGVSEEQRRDRETVEKTDVFRRVVEPRGPNLREDKPAGFNNKAKREAVGRALLAHPDKSNREIAALTNTTHPFVAKVRRAMASTVTTEEQRE